MFATLRRILSDETPGLRAKVLGIYALLFSANVVLWIATLLTSFTYPVFFLLAATAYTLGLRHAFDADHIAAIDNVTRKLMHEKKKPATVGLFFSLGHSTVVFVVAVLIGLGAKILSQGIQNGRSPLETTAGLVGTAISAAFLFLMALINIVILVQIVRAFRSVTRSGVYDDEEVEIMLNQRGFLARIFRGLFRDCRRELEDVSGGPPVWSRVRHRDRDRPVRDRWHCRYLPRAFLFSVPAATHVYGRDDPHGYDRQHYDVGSLWLGVCQAHSQAVL